MKKVMVFFLLAALFTAPPLFAETPAKTTDSGTKDQGKLDKIIASQQEILKQLEEIKQELQIVKIRATR